MFLSGRWLLTLPAFWSWPTPWWGKESHLSSVLVSTVELI